MREWFEIFRTGTHTDANGVTREWTESDLDAIAAGYDASLYEAPVVIGHPVLNAPAYGWIEAVKRTGDKLLAKAKQLAPEFVELVRQGSYKKVSIALTPENKLRHVGFLGAAAPAIEGLQTAEFASAPEAVAYEFSSEELQLFPPLLETPVKQLQDTLERLRKLEEKLTAIANAQSPVQQSTQQVTGADIQKFCQFAEHKTEQGYLTPAQKQLLLDAVNAAVSQGQQQFSESQTLSLFTQFIELLPKQIQLQRFVSKPARETGGSVSALEQLRKIFAAQTLIRT